MPERESGMSKEIKLNEKEKLLFFSVVLTMAAAVGILFYNSLVVSGILAILFSAALPKYKEGILKKRRQEAMSQFRDLLYSISASVSSGRNMAEALREAKTFCGASYEETDYIMLELDHMTAMLENGNATDTEVLYDFARRSGLEDIEDFARAYENCKVSGADLKQAINTAARLIGDKIELEGELKTLLSQKIFEGRIVGISPFIIVLMIRLTAPDYISPMTESSQGLVITTVAVALMLIAAAMTERINKIEI